MKITTLLFDLDGTLVDSAQEVAVILNEMRQKRGYGPCEISLFRDKISKGAAGIVECALGFSNEETVDLVDEFRTLYKTTPTPKTSLYPGAEETLFRFKNEGYKLAIVSNKPGNLCHNVLSQTGLEKYFDCVVAATPSLRSKPHPAPIQAAMLNMGSHKREAVLIGDSRVDQIAAFEAGVPFIFFAEGYNDGVNQNKAFACISELKELLELSVFYRNQNIWVNPE